MSDDLGFAGHLINWFAIVICAVIIGFLLYAATLPGTKLFGYVIIALLIFVFGYAAFFFYCFDRNI